MARLRVMYWKEIPVQVQAEDDSGRVSRPLDDRFQKAADAVAMKDGSQGTDEYLLAFCFKSSRAPSGCKTVYCRTRSSSYGQTSSEHDSGLRS